MRALRICLALVAVAIVVSACSIPYPSCDLDAVRYPAGARLQGDSLRLGVTNASPLFSSDLPAPLRQTQASIAVLDDVRWGRVEPEPPQNGRHIYEWDDESVALDTRVHAYQQEGFELVMVLRAWNTWARSVGPQGGIAAAGASTLPKSEYQEDYVAWIAAVVERYDADGIEDAPNLSHPVRYFQIETEAVTGVWWQSADAATATDDYLDLLRSARAAAKAANPDAQILLAGIPALDLLDGYPTARGSKMSCATSIPPCAEPSSPTISFWPPPMPMTSPWCIAPPITRVSSPWPIGWRPWPVGMYRSGSMAAPRPRP